MSLRPKTNITAKTWNIIKALARVTVRSFVETIHRLVINIFDTLFVFLNWPEKKLRVKVFILRDPQDNPVISPVDLDVAVEYVKRSFKKNFNTRVLPHKN